MQHAELDTDRILASSEQWLHLEKKWGQPVDLDADDDGVGTLHGPSDVPAFTRLHKSLERSLAFDGFGRHNLQADDESTTDDTGDRVEDSLSLVLQSGAKGLLDSSVSSSNVSFEDGEGYSADVESVSELQMSASDKCVICKCSVKGEVIDVERYKWIKSTHL